MREPAILAPGPAADARGDGADVGVLAPSRVDTHGATPRHATRPTRAATTGGRCGGGRDAHTGSAHGAIKVLLPPRTTPTRTPPSQRALGGTLGHPGAAPPRAHAPREHAHAKPAPPPKRPGGGGAGRRRAAPGGTATAATATRRSSDELTSRSSRNAREGKERIGLYPKIAEQTVRVTAWSRPRS